MIVVGLTGGIASGKSTVARMFAEEGAYIIDLDELSRLVVEPHKPAWRDIVRHFGDEILTEERTLDRDRLGSVVFSDPAKRRKLEGIVHPRILEAYGKRLQRILEKNEQAIVIADVPLLMEVEMEGSFDKVIVVYIPPESQMKRIVQRNGLSQEEARNRLKSQMPIEEKARRGDFVIDNSGTLEETGRQVKEIYEKLKMLEVENRSSGRR